MANYSFILRDPYKPGTEEIQKEIRKMTDAKKRNQKQESILSLEQVPVRLYVSFDRDHRFYCNTGLQVYSKQWDFEKQLLKWQAAGSQEFNKGLTDLRESVQAYYAELLQQKPKPTFEQIRENIQEFVATKNKPRFTEKEISFFQAYNQYMEIRGYELSHRTIQKFESTRKVLEKFTKDRFPRFNFDTIDLLFFDKFKRYLQYEIYNQKADFLKNKDEHNKEQRKGFRDDTTAKHIETLKNFLKWSYERNLHKNEIFKHSKFKAARQNNLDIVTLNINELKHFYEFDLSKNPVLDRVRDAFCFGAFTGQRWSDISSFRKEDIKGDTWIFTAYKTDKPTVIPLVGYAAPALDILKKCDFKLPEITNQKFNVYLKEAAKLAGLNRMVEINRYQGNKKLTFKIPLHRVISSHMARRTAVSILLNVYRMPVNQVMEITKHSDFKTLKRYIDKDIEALRATLAETRSVTEIMSVVKSKTA